MFDKIIYYTNAKGGQGFDILLECNSFKSFNVFLNATEKAVQISSPDCEPIFLEGCDFDKKIISLIKDGYSNEGEEDISDYDTTDWEIFYTNSKADDYLIDYIEIDVENKRYSIAKDEKDYITGGYDLFGNPVKSSYMSREAFRMLIKGFKTSNYTEIKEE